MLQKVFNKRGQIIVPNVFWRKTFIEKHFQFFYLKDFFLNKTSKGLTMQI